MPRVRLFQPVDPKRIPSELAAALRSCKHPWVIAEMVTAEVIGASQAEILRLREINDSLKKQLQLERQKRGKMPEVNTEVKDYEAIYQEVKGLIARGQLVQCSGPDYPQYRRALHGVAASMVDDRQDVYANIALNEVRRLDKRFNYSPE